MHSGQPKPLYEAPEESAKWSGSYVEIVSLKVMAEAVLMHIQRAGRKRIPDNKLTD